MKNYIFLVLWIIYFIYHLISKDNNIILETTKSFAWWDVIFSYISAILWCITWLWIIWILTKYLEIFLIKITKKTKTVLDDILAQFVIKFINITKYLAVFYLFFYIAKVPDNIRLWAEKVSSVMLIIVFLILLTSFINVLFWKDIIMKSKLKAVSKTLLPLINKAIVAIVWIIWFITILGNLGYDVTALIAWAWIWGLAVALAAQKTIANMFWALTILLNKPFTIWDTVIIDAHTGVVKEIWLSYTTLFDRLWHQVMISNDTIINTSIENLTVRRNRRTDFTIWIVYWTSLEKMQEWVKIIETILEKYVGEETIASFRVNFDMFWDFSLNINSTYFSLLNDDFVLYLKQKESINLEIKKQFALAWIDMAFPTQELIIKKES